MEIRVLPGCSAPPAPGASWPGASADARGEDGFQLVSVSAESPDGHREPTQLLVLADFGLGGFSWEVSWCCSWVFSALFLVIQTNGL